MSSIFLKVECIAGYSVSDVCEEMQALADRIGIHVEGQINDVRCMAVVGGRASDLHLNYANASDGSRPHKFASSK
jgi:hypothetical protein